MFSKKRAITGIAVATGAALALAGCAGGSEPAGTLDPDEEVTLDLAFWGNDVRAEMYNEAIAAFEEEYPNITVNSSFLDFPAFWERRQTEAAGGNLPDVMQFDYSYLRQYSENGLLLDLDPYLGNVIQTDPIPQNILDIGVVGGTTYGIATSTNAWGMYTNPTLLAEVGVDEFAGGTWDDYAAWMGEVTEASGGEVWGGSDYAGRIQNFEIQLRAEGGALFTEDGEPGFDEARLAEFWEDGQEVIASGAVISAQRLEEIFPTSGFGAALTASELTWDNFGAGYLGELGEGYPELGLVAPPITVEGAQDLYLKPSMLHSIAANTDHPEAAATLVDFLVNSPQSGEIFGTNRGLPASETALDAADLDPLSEQIRDYEASIQDRLGDAPPVPIVGYGTLEEEFRVLGQELGFGTISVEDAVDRFFTEMDVVLSNNS
ncbi:ABC transporter substrate-binding protein [Microbacterium aurantiacum]|uniref:ABC transporter substrate-binding protein n=1 Tax=Microbacterium aurantiacum TaxID=162393 RepID=UPI003D75D8F1